MQQVTHGGRLGRALWSAVIWLFWAAKLGAQTGSDSTVFTVAPSSILEVHAGKSGLLGGLGHEHRIRAHGFDGGIVYFPAEPARSRVSITVFTDSLRVVPEADSADIPEITKTMRERTLQVDRYPTITFVSTAIEPIPGGLRVSGDLTIAGATRATSVDMRLNVQGDTLHAGGEFTVKQTDFGIKPYKKALGLVKVANEIRFEVKVIGTGKRETGKR